VVIHILIYTCSHLISFSKDLYIYMGSEYQFYIIDELMDGLETTLGEEIGIGIAAGLIAGSAGYLVGSELAFAAGDVTLSEFLADLFYALFIGGDVAAGTAG
jgi:hypothetical protein